MENKKKPIGVLALNFQQYKVHAFNLVRRLDGLLDEDFKYDKSGRWEGKEHFIVPLLTYRSCLVLGYDWTLMYVGEWYKNPNANAIRQRYEMNERLKGKGNGITDIIQEDCDGEDPALENLDRRVADKIRERASRREEDPVRRPDYSGEERWSFK